MKLIQNIRSRFFNAMYMGTPPWDIGQPQQEFVKLAQAGEILGDVLDVGCGTGENALYLAGFGHEVWGVDISFRAIKKAKMKSQKRGVKATFLTHDALDLQSLKRTFETVIDSGLFHVLSDKERPLFARSLHTTLKPLGKYYMLCFSERELDWGGPRRVTQAEIRATFSEEWRINYIREATLGSTIHDDALGWLSSITRL